MKKAKRIGGLFALALALVLTACGRRQCVAPG